MNLNQRHVKYTELKPCTNAFIDTRSPGSDQKENFTIIGPGVAENPDQHVHISLAHGFNIGGARQPPGCLNSQHSHLTEEVFVVHQGDWAFLSGVNANDGRIVLKPGDVISIPTDIFRGFENVGQDTGYLHAVLGGDDPGRVLWAPSVFELAKEYGLILLENGKLVDTTLGEEKPRDEPVMPVTTAEQIAEHRVVSSEALNDIVIRKQDFQWSTSTALGRFKGIKEAPLVGGESKEEGIGASSLSWPHNFVVRALSFEGGATIPAHKRFEEEVIFIHEGELHITVDGESLVLNEGDNFTTPIEAVRTFENRASKECIAYITRRNNVPKAPEFL
ncbi:cupin domain-containing protein [Alteromonadaceae bacterium M269]|nr:cupin domain-containing protein [Alteromonadaceae bacterium M269]